MKKFRIITCVNVEAKDMHEVVQKVYIRKYSEVELWRELLKATEIKEIREVKGTRKKGGNKND